MLCGHVPLFKPERPQAMLALEPVQSDRGPRFAFPKITLGWLVCMFGLLPLIFALLVAETTADAHPLLPLQGAWTLPLIVLSGVVLWALINEALAHVIARRGQRRLLGRWELIAQTIMLLWFTWVCYGWGWSSWAAHGHQFGYTCAIIPWVAMQAAHWWGLTPAVRAISGYPWTRRGLMMNQFRFGVLPMALVLSLLDIGAWIAGRWNLEPWFNGYWGLLLGAYLAQIFMIAILIVLPLLLMPLWGAKPMFANDLQRLMQDACRRMGVRVAGLMRWPVPGGKVYNAAVVGMMPRLRYVLFTDDLMRDLTPNQVLAVLGHELGHARHGHLWLYFLFANSTVMISFLVNAWLPGELRPLLGSLPGHSLMGSDDPWAPLVKLAVGLSVMAVQFRLVFGYLSRACERQADLAGAELVGDTRIMGDALKSVAHLSGQPENEPSWRHYSIAERIDFLDRVHRRPELAGWHNHLVRSMRNGLIALILTLFVAVWMFDPRHDAPSVSGTRAALAQWVDQDHDLDNALKLADHGDVLVLKTWLNRADESDRAKLAAMFLTLATPDEGQDAAGKPVPVFDDRVGYRYRNRLRPFIDVSTGDRDLDLVMDNALGYFLVAGTEEPTLQDLKVAQMLLPRLEEHMKTAPKHMIFDTIGCIEAALDNHAKALEAFSEATRLLVEDRTINESDVLRLHFNDLYSHRLEVARYNHRNAALPGFVAVPIPRDWPGAPVSALPMPPILRHVGPAPAPASGQPQIVPTPTPGAPGSETPKPVPPTIVPSPHTPDATAPGDRGATL